MPSHHNDPCTLSLSRLRLHLNINFPPLCLLFSEAQQNWAAFMNELFSLFFFMNERLSLTSSVSLWRCMQMNVWMEQRRDWQTAPKALSPSLTHKLPSNHRRVGWLMLYTHTHLYTEAEPIQYMSAVFLSSNISCTSAMLLKSDIKTPVKCFLLI